MTLIQTKLIESYTVLVLAGRKTIEQVPADIKSEVEIKVAEKTVEVLS